MPGQPVFRCVTGLHCVNDSNAIPFMYESIRTCALLLLSALLLSGCDLIGPDTVPPDSRIEFIAAGGFGGGVLQKLTVTEEGLVVNEAVRPPLQHPLSEREHRELLDVFEGFFGLKATYNAHVCADDVTYTITLRTSTRSKTVSAAGCSLWREGGHRSAPARLARMVSTLSGLAREVYEDEAPVKSQRWCKSGRGSCRHPEGDRFALVRLGTHDLADLA